MNGSSGIVARFVTVTMGLVIGLTFLFGFGNVLSLALKLQVPMFVAPLVAPAVDLTVLGLLVGTRHLAMTGAGDHVLRPARHLLLAASVVTLLLNVADPVCAGQWGKAAFDSVGPLLLIGWAEAGPGLLRALSAAEANPGSENLPPQAYSGPIRDGAEAMSFDYEKAASSTTDSRVGLDEDLLERARLADADHWRRHQRRISAETLRKQLPVGATTSRLLVAEVRRSSAVPNSPDSGRADD